MAQHSTEQTDAAETHSAPFADTKTDKTCIYAFQRRAPLMFSPKRQYALAVISPRQKQDSCETVIADDRSGSPSTANNWIRETSIEITRGRPGSLRRLVRFQPFSFDARDAARKVEFERRLQVMRQMQEQCSPFKAHPVRRYKPIIQLSVQTTAHSQQSK